MTSTLKVESFQTDGLIAYYLWTAATTVILLNILISLFTSAYENIVSDASDQFLVFFTGKVISLTVSEVSNGKG